jgi:uncharacterized protein YoaH (UPF0181 family)
VDRHSHSAATAPRSPTLPRRHRHQRQQLEFLDLEGASASAGELMAHGMSNGELLATQHGLSQNGYGNIYIISIELLELSKLINIE